MTAKIIIEKKRFGRALSTSEIREFIEDYTAGKIPDYQMSALAMAICCRGMNERETADLVNVMTKSGCCLEWEMPTADKHSTGGVGDKFSFLIQPLVAACGIAVPSLVGRGLGTTGGTADKLEAIPGYRADVSLKDFQRIVKKVGLSMATATNEIAKADRKLYALRDVTGTIASIPLITASILSKKLAEGVGTLVFDVKCGSGAFMKTREEAEALAESLVAGAKAAGRKAAALVTNMSAPLGRAVGNANEIMEAMEWLKGNEIDSDEVALCLEFAAMSVSLTKEISLDEARRLCREKLLDGSAMTKFRDMVAAHGGDLAAFALLEERTKVFRFQVQSVNSGFITAIDAGRVAQVALNLGAGRAQVGDKIDFLAGVRFDVRCGDRVSAGAPLATLTTSRSPQLLETAAAELLKAFTIGPERITPIGLTLTRID